MTDDRMTLPALLEKTPPDAGYPRKMIGFAAQRRMERDIESRTGAAHGECSPDRLDEKLGYPCVALQPLRDFLGDAVERGVRFLIGRLDAAIEPRPRLIGALIGARRRNGPSVRHSESTNNRKIILVWLGAPARKL